MTDPTQHAESVLAGDAYEMLLELPTNRRTASFVAVMVWLRGFIEGDHSDGGGA